MRWETERGELRMLSQKKSLVMGAVWGILTVGLLAQAEPHRVSSTGANHLRSHTAKPALSVRTGAWEGSSGNQVHLDSWLEKVRPGDILILGENHGLRSHQNEQLRVMQALRNQGLRVSVGLEFFQYPDQDYVHQYCSGHLEEASFLDQIRWGAGISFDYYRAQALFPDRSEGSLTWALNAPRSLTQKVALGGMSSLSEEERQILPPQFALGRDSYRERFLELMPHELPVRLQDNYFAAQSIWDDTMAWRAIEFIESHSDQVFVIVVGDFHASYGGGLQDRLKARGYDRTWVLSQVNGTDLTDAEIQGEIQPNPRWGVRADLILVSEEL